MQENPNAQTPSTGDERLKLVREYLDRALAASNSGDSLLGMHLYLAAFEEATAEGNIPREEALDGLKQAWSLACSHKERSLAEYIFEKMEPYLNAGEIAECAEQLQSLALAKLEEFGLSREELEEMTELISQDFLGMDGPVIKVEHVTEGSGPRSIIAAKAMGRMPSHASDSPAAVADAGKDAGAGAAPAEDAMLSEAAAVLQDKLALPQEVLDYSTLAGYGSTVELMRDFGIGMQGDAQFAELVELLNRRHGLESMPAVDTLLFRSPAREDAYRFMEATVGEIGRPCVHMRMEENLAGQPVLCVSAQAKDMPKPSALRDAFANGGVLVLEDIDLWSAPVLDMSDDPASVFAASLSRGARDAIGLIRSAVDDPEVYVLASAAEGSDIDGFFLDLMEPVSVVDIDYPTPEERVDIWMDLAHQHPSLRAINGADVVRLSANMPRFDIYMACREALEEAYKQGLMAKSYRPVTADNLFDKLAAYQPLDSREYHELEESVIRSFRQELEGLEDMLGEDR